MKLTLERAEEILKKHTTEEHLFTHALAVSSAMGAMAEHFGEDPEYWRAIGYLHDVDYEKFPEEHCKHVRELLAPEGVEEEDIRAIISHGYGLCTEEVKPETNLEKSLFAVDDKTSALARAMRAVQVDIWQIRSLSAPSGATRARERLWTCSARRAG